ncbi:acyl-CoA thioesterase [Mesorhizobium sp. PUT5]|uniref:acyl-CoA thioesterase n=1 Tax=Mesorhizobium sp. PUT5 TaxID=3454629 RepID=UPI003FA40D79
MTISEGRQWTSGARLRFADLDGLGHVNSLSLAALVEDGRMRIILNMPMTPRSEFMLVSLTMHYLAPAGIDHDVKVTTMLARVGRSSFTLSHTLEQASTCLARAESVVVHVDQEARKSLPLSEEQLQFLQ